MSITKINLSPVDKFLAFSCSAYFNIYISANSFPLVIRRLCLSTQMCFWPSGIGKFNILSIVSRNIWGHSVIASVQFAFRTKHMINTLLKLDIADLLTIMKAAVKT